MGIALDEYTPDHSTISRTRRLIDLDTHREVFSWVLGVLADRGLLQGQRIAIDATTLEANAAMRSIVRRDTGASYEEFLRGLQGADQGDTTTVDETLCEAARNALVIVSRRVVVRLVLGDPARLAVSHNDTCVISLKLLNRRNARHIGNDMLHFASHDTVRKVVRSQQHRAWNKDSTKLQNG